jgi:hypothetical protein
LHQFFQAKQTVFLLNLKDFATIWVSDGQSRTILQILWRELFAMLPNNPGLSKQEPSR